MFSIPHKNCGCFGKGNSQNVAPVWGLNHLCVMATPVQDFRFMVGLGHCPMISKYDPSLSKAVGPVDPSFLNVNNLTLIKLFTYS